MSFPAGTLYAQETPEESINQLIESIRQRAETPDDSAASAIEKKILQVLTPEQTEDFLRGADPAEILLPSGENLMEFIGRLESSLDKGGNIFQGNIVIEHPTNQGEALYIGTSGSYSYVNSWGPGGPRNLFLNGSVGVKTTAPQADLHVYGGTGSAEILIEADTDNFGEADQPKITLTQDGGQVVGNLGYFDETNHLKLINNFSGATVLLRANGDICIGSNC